MYPRNITPSIIAALQDAPVVLLNGARQTGKSTLAEAICQGRYYTLDDPSVYAAAKSDPSQFINSLPSSVILDEVQRAPELFLPIKASVDKNRKPGRFLLTGSANVLMLPNLSESLAGRMTIFTLYPLSYGERLNIREGFIDSVFQANLPSDALEPLDIQSFIQTLALGGYPEILTLNSSKRRAEWFQSYLDTLLLRDVRELANIEGLKSMPLLMEVLANRAGNLLNSSDIARTVGIPYTTLNRYMALLEAMFLVKPLQPWFSNHTKRLVKSPKVYLCDTGLLSHIRGSEIKDTELGVLLENFVVSELLKQASWAEHRARLYHFRTTHGQNEVDIVLESRGRVVGIEIKARGSISSKDFQGMRVLQEMAGDKFMRGIILYLGQHVVPFGEQFWAVPVSALWTMGSQPAPPLSEPGL
jgi:predicted AAA+ superfamily ATPase